MESFNENLTQCGLIYRHFTVTSRLTIIDLHGAAIPWPVDVIGRHDNSINPNESNRRTELEDGDDEAIYFFFINVFLSLFFTRFKELKIYSEFIAIINDETTYIGSYFSFNTFFYIIKNFDPIYDI